MKSPAQNSHWTRRLGQPCCRCWGRSRRLSLVLQRLGQGMTLKPQVPRWAWGRGVHRDGQGQGKGCCGGDQGKGCCGGVRVRGAPCPLPYLQVSDQPTPATALLAVDAADGQAQHLGFQLRVGVDLEVGGGGGERAVGTVPRARIPPASTPTSALCRQRVSVSHCAAQRAVDPRQRRARHQGRARATVGQGDIPVGLTLA